MKIMEILKPNIRNVVASVVVSIVLVLILYDWILGQCYMLVDGMRLVGGITEGFAGIIYDPFCVLVYVVAIFVIAYIATSIMFSGMKPAKKEKRGRKA
jgi:hypothetical protein